MIGVEHNYRPVYQSAQTLRGRTGLDPRVSTSPVSTAGYSPYQQQTVQSQKAIWALLPRQNPHQIFITVDSRGTRL